MRKRTKASDLPVFDGLRPLNNEVAIAAYVTDILGAGNPGLLIAALDEIAGARAITEVGKAGTLAGAPLPNTGERLSPTKAALRRKLMTRQKTRESDWLAFQKSRKEGRARIANKRNKDAP